MDLVQKQDRLALMGVNLDGIVHLLQSFFSVTDVPYSMDRRLIAFSWEPSLEGLSKVTELTVDAFAVWRAVCVVPREDHQVHIK